jgi:acyl-CoA synthetase (AMP-forming)/AMP-acid ligase II
MGRTGECLDWGRGGHRPPAAQNPKQSPPEFLEWSGGESNGGAEEPGSKHKEIRSIYLSEDGSPVYITEKAESIRVRSVRSFFSLTERQTLFCAGEAIPALADLAVDVALNLGGTLVLSASLERTAMTASSKGLHFDSGFAWLAGNDGTQDAPSRSSDVRKVFGGCRSVITPVLDRGRQVRLEKALHVPVVGCFATARTGIVTSNHYHWNVHGSLGVPVTGAEAAILAKEGAILTPGKSGELLVSGPMVDIEHAPEKSKEVSGWLKTGLTAEVDLSGILHLLAQARP